MHAEKFRTKWKGLADTILRFPFSSLLFAAAVISNTFAIITKDEEEFSKRLISFLIGASISIVLQLLYERYFENKLVRYVFMAISGAFALLYGILVWNQEWKEDIAIRTAVIFFILFIAFLVVPVIKSKNNFNESFMAAFKSFFASLLFFGVLFLGVSLILAVTDQLITSVHEDAYLHAANLIFILMAPIYFLSSIPYYPGKQELKSGYFEAKEEMVRRREALGKQIAPSKFLETLISYIFIPITVVFTIILLLYIVLNITGDFWTNNLLEPLLVTYSITVLIVYLLASALTNKFAVYFRMIFPKVLIPVVLFQTISSFLRIEELGVTYGRYYVILFGVFATVAGILFSILPVRKNGMIAPILIGLSILSILPPVDAFTLSRANQISRLEEVLKKNDMLNGNNVIPNENVSKEDQQIIATAVNYLNRMNDTQDVQWLTSYSETSDFETTFGFPQYEGSDTIYESYYFAREINEPIPVDGYDFMVRRYLSKETVDAASTSFVKENKTYTLRFSNTDPGSQEIILEEADGNELIRFHLIDFIQQFEQKGQGKEMLSTKEMTFHQENNAVGITIIAETISIDEWSSGKQQSMDAYILIRIK